jgi:hypothetical protein
VATWWEEIGPTIRKKYIVGKGKGKGKERKREVPIPTGNKSRGIGNLFHITWTFSSLLDNRSKHDTRIAFSATKGLTRTLPLDFPVILKYTTKKKKGFTRVLYIVFSCRSLNLT